MTLVADWYRSINWERAGLKTLIVIGWIIAVCALGAVFGGLAYMHASEVVHDQVLQVTQTAKSTTTTVVGDRYYHHGFAGTITIGGLCATAWILLCGLVTGLLAELWGEIE